MQFQLIKHTNRKSFRSVSYVCLYILFIFYLYIRIFSCFIRIMQYIRIIPFPVFGEYYSCDYVYLYRNAVKNRMILHLSIFRKPHEIHPLLADFFHLPAGTNITLESVCHSLEHRSRVSNRFSSPGRMRCVQFPVVQFLKLGAGHSDGCILW